MTTARSMRSPPATSSSRAAAAQTEVLVSGSSVESVLTPPTPLSNAGPIKRSPRPFEGIVVPSGTQSTSTLNTSSLALPKKTSGFFARAGRALAESRARRDGYEDSREQRSVSIEQQAPIFFGRGGAARCVDDACPS